MYTFCLRAICAALLLVTVFSTTVLAAAFGYQMTFFKNAKVPAMSLIGYEQIHVIGKNETLLDIARQYGLGYNELKNLYPGLDPWVPPAGMEISIPGFRILPDTKSKSVVINIPEMRLYKFFPEHHLVKTYPIGIGRQGFNTPTGQTRVVTRQKDPEWTVTEASRERVGKAVVPPGPDNPLGKYWVGLADNRIGIHGTNFAWGIGRRVSQGCIRMYPEHIETFFNEVSVGDVVEIIYAPVKAGVHGNTIFLEIHPDIHDIVSDIYSHAEMILKERGLLSGVDRQLMRQAIAAKRGVPEPVGIVGKH